MEREAESFEGEELEEVVVGEISDCETGEESDAASTSVDNSEILVSSLTSDCDKMVAGAESVGDEEELAISGLDSSIGLELGSCAVPSLNEKELFEMCESGVAARAKISPSEGVDSALRKGAWSMGPSLRGEVVDEVSFLGDEIGDERGAPPWRLLAASMDLKNCSLWREAWSSRIFGVISSVPGR
jgi:hypothetical protein